MAKMQRIFEPFFKFCPNCGGEFEFNEDREQYICNKCGQHGFRVMQRYYSNYVNLRREQFKDYPQGD